MSTSDAATPPLHHHESIDVRASAEDLYDLVSDVTRTGEWSPVCRACWWEDDAEPGTVGARFRGRNETPERTWETRSQVVAASRGREFAWVVGEGFVRWGFTFEHGQDATRLTESWDFLPAGLEFFHTTYAERAEEEIAERSRAALSGVPRTLAAVKRIAEGDAPA